MADEACKGRKAGLGPSRPVQEFNYSRHAETQSQQAAWRFFFLHKSPVHPCCDSAAALVSFFSEDIVLLH